MRMIDADMIPNYKLDVLAKAGEMEVPCKFRIVHWKDIEAMPTIDPESLPVVQQLRAELEKVKAERDAAVKDLRECVIEIEADCMYCSHEINGTLCRNCINGANWEWRGVKEN